ncbi:MAG: DASS family sodium-coupled anion symporter [Flavobacteriales bacterium]|nr:DASS family sodium-coupled anion symporter [Flavobacteriales bacterium]
MSKYRLFKNKWFFGMLGIALAFACYFFVPSAEYPQAPIMAAIVIVMAVFWIFEVVPIAITSLFPIFLFPLFGILDTKSTALFFGKEIIFLFLGGLMLAQGIQNSNLHKRIALHIVNLIGSKPANLVLGFMVATAGLSMWISNTASVMVMMPIGLSIIEEIKEVKNSKNFLSKFAVALMLGIAYAADIGGMATLIGTPPNLVFMEMYHELFPELPAIGFTQWMMMGLPISITFLFTGWLLMTKVIFRMPKIQVFKNKDIIKDLLKDLGKLRRDELASGLIFLTAAILWVTGSDITLSESFTIHGWRSALGLEMVSDASIAVATSLLLFMIPSKDKPKEMLLTWSKVRELPWGILLLFGGGFAIAGGFNSSGLSTIIGNVIANIGIDSPILIIIIVCTVLTFLTEITSNTATTNLILPILAKASAVLGLDPRILMIPATLSASCALMMPIASPTQAIVFGSGHVKIKQMIRAGILFNLLGIVIVTGVFYLLAKFVFGIVI